MIVRPKRSFPGTTFYLRGSAISHIWPVLLALVVYAGCVEWFLQNYQLTEHTLTVTPFSLVGLALSIFLGFRNNACYDRWWEARKLWGAWINTTRYTTRLLLNLLHSDDASEQDEVAALQRELVYRVIAYTHALRLVLRQQLDRMDSDLGPFLPAAELASLKRESNVPAAIAQRLGDRLMDGYRRGWVDPLHLPMLQEALNRFMDIQGGCERIKNTPVPLSYTMLTHRIVGLYCVALPFGIHDVVGEFTPVVVLIIAFAFLGLDAVGTQIEDPFEEDPNDLPLLSLSRMIETNLRQRLGETDLPAAVVPDRGVLI